MESRANRKRQADEYRSKEKTYSDEAEQESFKEDNVQTVTDHSIRVVSEKHATSSTEIHVQRFSKAHTAPYKLSRLGIEQKQQTVFIWDLDETLIIFQTLSPGVYTRLFNKSKDAELGMSLGRRWEDLIFQVFDEVTVLEQAETCLEPNINSLRDYDDGADLSNYDFSSDASSDGKRKTAHLLRCIRDLYPQGIEKLISKELASEWQELYAATDEFTDGWLSAGRSILEACAKPSPGESASNVNVLVTSSFLVPSLLKCMLYRLNTFFKSTDIYSSREAGKLQCFNWIKERFPDAGTKFCVIGDGIDECQAAEALRWPFVKVEMMPDGLNYLPTLTLKTIEEYISIIYD